MGHITVQLFARPTHRFSEPSAARSAGGADRQNTDGHQYRRSPARQNSLQLPVRSWANEEEHGQMKNSGICQTIVCMLMLVAIPAVQEATAQQPQWPRSINAANGFYVLGRAIAAEPGFPREGSDVEKARYVHARLPNIAMAYGLKAAAPFLRPLDSFQIGADRLVDEYFVTDPENASSLKGPVRSGNCGEWTYAFSQILGGAGVVSQVVYGDTSSAPGYSGAHGGTDTTLIVEERTTNKDISRRVFDAYRPGWETFFGYPTAETTAQYSDLPLTDADKLPRDVAAGTRSFQQITGKPVFKDAGSQQLLPDVPERFRRGSEASAARQAIGKVRADLNAARALIKEARDDSATAQAKLRELEDACSGVEPAVAAAQAATEAATTAEGLVDAAASACSAAPTDGEIEAARQAASLAVGQLRDLAARSQASVDQACVMASSASAKGSLGENASSLARFVGAASEALARARERVAQAAAIETRRMAARDKGQEARTALDSAQEACDSASVELSRAHSLCQKAEDRQIFMLEYSLVGQEKKSSALGALDTISSTVVPGLPEASRTEIIAQVSSLRAEANSITFPSPKSPALPKAWGRFDSAQAALDQAKQKLASVERRLAACDSVLRVDGINSGATAAADAAQAPTQEIERLVAKARNCGETEAASSSKGSVKPADAKDKAKSCAPAVDSEAQKKALHARIAEYLKFRKDGGDHWHPDHTMRAGYSVGAVQRKATAMELAAMTRLVDDYHAAYQRYWAHHEGQRPRLMQAIKDAEREKDFTSANSLRQDLARLDSQAGKARDEDVRKADDEFKAAMKRAREMCSQ